MYLVLGFLLCIIVVPCKVSCCGQCPHHHILPSKCHLQYHVCLGHLWTVSLFSFETHHLEVWLQTVIIHICTYQIDMKMWLDMMISHRVLCYDIMMSHLWVVRILHVKVWVECDWLLALCVLVLLMHGLVLMGLRHSLTLPWGLFTNRMLLHHSDVSSTPNSVIICFLVVTRNILWKTVVMCMLCTLGDVWYGSLPSLTCNKKVPLKQPVYEENNFKIIV